MDLPIQRTYNLYFSQSKFSRASLHSLRPNNGQHDIFKYAALRACAALSDKKLSLIAKPGKVENCLYIYAVNLKAPEIVKLIPQDQAKVVHQVTHEFYENEIIMNGAKIGDLKPTEWFFIPITEKEINKIVKIRKFSLKKIKLLSRLEEIRKSTNSSTKNSRNFRKIVTLYKQSIEIGHIPAGKYKLFEITKDGSLLERASCFVEKKHEEIVLEYKIIDTNNLKKIKKKDLKNLVLMPISK